MDASSDEKSAAVDTKGVHENANEIPTQDGTKGQAEAAPVAPQDGNSGSQAGQHCEILVLSVSAQGGVKGKSGDLAQHGAVPAAGEPAIPTDGGAVKEAAAEASQGRVHNPDFSAVARNLASHEAEAMVKMEGDIDRARREGDPDDLCSACEKRARHVCDVCRMARYCGRECQVGDWPIHSNVCAAFAAARPVTRPSPDHRRVLLFPASSFKAEVRWALPSDIAKEEPVEFNHADFVGFMRTLDASTNRLVKQTQHTLLNTMNSLGDRHIGHMLTAITFTNPRPLQDPINPKLVNRSINALTRPGYLRPWFGPVVVFADARRPSEPVLSKIRDVSCRDFYSIVCYIKSQDSICVPNPALTLGEVIAGLRINDPSTELNRALGVVRIFDETHVPLQPFYRSDNAIAMAFHLGLRWYIRPGNFLGLKSGETDWNDANLRYLAYVCNIREVWPDTPHSRTTPLRHEAVFGWGPFASSVIILHGSGRPVFKHHVAAFNQYLDSVVARKGVASKKGFKRYWSGYRRRLGDQDRNMPSPYKSEEKGRKDRLGVFDADFVKLQIASKITDVWVAIVDNLHNFNRRKVVKLQAEAARQELFSTGLDAAKSIVCPGELF